MFATRWLTLRARVELAAGTPEGLRAAARHGRRLTRTSLPGMRAHGLLVLAAVATRQGQVELAAQRFEEAGRLFDALGLPLEQNLVRCCLGRLLGGAEGQALVETAHGWFEKRSIRNFGQLVASF